MRDNDNDNGQRRFDRSSRRAFLIGSSATMLGAGFAGCTGNGGNGNGNGNGGNGNGNGNGGGDDGEVAGDGDGNDEPEKPDQLTVRAWGGVWQESIQTNVAEPFTEETGIDVQFDNTDGPIIRGDIRSAVQQDREPPVNVNWDLVTIIHQSYLQGLVEPLDPDIITNIDGMRAEARPDVEDAELPYVNLYPYTYALCYNEDAVEEAQGNREPVSSWESLWDSQYEGMLGGYDDPPGGGLIPVLAEMSDTELGPAEEMGPVWDLVEDLAPNIGFLGTDQSIAQTLRDGEIAYAMAYLPNNLVTARDEGEPVGWTIPEEGATVRMDGLYTPKNQPESTRYWAQQFVNTALRQEAQQSWMESLQVPMLHQDIEPPEWMSEDPAFPTSSEDFEQLLSTPLDVYAEHSSSWSEQFSQTIN